MRPRLREEVLLLREDVPRGEVRELREAVVPSHAQGPWVCNGCERRPTCPLGQFAYSARVAQAKADERLVESRRGLDMTGREMAFLAREVKAGLARGQSVHHIFASRDDPPARSAPSTACIQSSKSRQFALSISYTSPRACLRP